MILEKTDQFGNTVYIIKKIENKNIKEIFIETINIKRNDIYQNIRDSALVFVNNNGNYYDYNGYIDFYNKSRISNYFKRLLSLRFN